jgi:hypothetical protein
VFLLYDRRQWVVDVLPGEKEALTLNGGKPVVGRLNLSRVGGRWSFAEFGEVEIQPIGYRKSFPAVPCPAASCERLPTSD